MSTKRTLCLLFYARNVLLLSKFNTNPNLPVLQLTSLTRPRLRSYASRSETQNQHNNGSIDVEDVSNQELKRRVDRYLEGDTEAIPSIFEAILSRKLAGEHDESDDELMEEIRRKTPGCGNEEEDD